MNHWAQMLTELPVIAQRHIARQQRISLPRGCTADERHLRLRRALCHAATVRTTYATLDAAVQAALQELRAQRGGMSKGEVTVRYGPARSWSQLAADPQPQTITELLLLIGWLLPRPATPHHPARYLLPPELRRWLPRPLHIPTWGAAPPPAFPPILLVSAMLLLLATEQPLAVRRDGQFRRTALQMFVQRLPRLATDAAEALATFALPLIHQLGLIAMHHNSIVTTQAGQQFLARPPEAQLAQLQQAWLMSSAPDQWLVQLVADTVGIDWPHLRQRLWQWGLALPADHSVDSTTLYEALSAALGPLADTHTHGFRHVDRMPWQARRAAAVWEAALRGPLQWLGLVQWITTPSSSTDTNPPHTWVARIGSFRAATTPTTWRYGTNGHIIIPHTALDARVLALVPFAQWQTADEDATTYRITRKSLARAAAAGKSVSALWTTLEAAAGPVPVAWWAALTIPASSARFAPMPVLLVEPPALLDRAARQRTVRRYIVQQPAPGVALVQPEHIPRLQRALERAHIAVVNTPPSVQPTAPAVESLSPGEAAALLVACAFYRRHAPPAAALVPYAELEQRLRAQLTPALRAAADAAIAQLAPPPPPSTTLPPDTMPAVSDTLPRLRRALAASEAIAMIYYTAGRDAWTERIVRPLALEQHDEHWYLRAYCPKRGTERTFRVDRIGAMEAATLPTIEPMPTRLPVEPQLGTIA